VRLEWDAARSTKEAAICTRIDAALARSIQVVCRAGLCGARFPRVSTDQPLQLSFSHSAGLFDLV